MSSGWFFPIIERQEEILKLVKLIKSDTTQIRQTNLAILRLVERLQDNSVSKSDFETLVNAVQALVQSENTDSAEIKQILKILTPQPAVSFEAIVTVDK